MIFLSRFIRKFHYNVDKCNSQGQIPDSRLGESKLNSKSEQNKSSNLWRTYLGKIHYLMQKFFTILMSVCTPCIHFLGSTSEYFPSNIYNGVMNMSKWQRPHLDENVSPRPPIGLQWTTRKPLHHRAGCCCCAGPKTSL